MREDQGKGVGVVGRGEGGGRGRGRGRGTKKGVVVRGERRQRIERRPLHQWLRGQGADGGLGWREVTGQGGWDSIPLG